MPSEEELLTRQMPHSTEAEQSVLGSMLIDARCVPEVIEALRPEDFYLRTNREIYETIYSMFNFSLTIDPVTVLEHMDALNPGKADIVPADGVLLPETTVAFSEGDTVFDVLQQVCRAQGIHMESTWTPAYNSAYIEGIGNLYEFDCGELSGWMYKVNGWFPNYGCSRYQLKEGDTIVWVYTCDLGVDVGGFYSTGG